MKFDEDIWAEVRPHKWKYRRRTVKPRLIELHATRSGIAGRTALQDYGSTKNWSITPNNFNAEPGDDWASMESYIIGGGKVCRVLPEEYYAHYSLGHADHLAFSIEIGQNKETTKFKDRDLELAAQLCAELSDKYDIPVRVLSWLSADNHEAPGYVRHDRSANGKRWDKTDPGKLFDDRAFEAAVRRFQQGEDDMAFIGVGCDKATIGTNQFESFRLYVTASGLTREAVPTSAQREALAAAGYPLLLLTRAQLAQYKKA